ncbi:MAG TPA: 3-oxoacyl-[acyl-carrier-protein] synthase III C-terminal domain-containing protein [Anaerolineae bacterium]|nr:3-oxoacyl-[acyl-carrier-protein] synthase III C-terminal domain-containing protein [Anaerolineae bacterium]
MTFPLSLKIAGLGHYLPDRIVTNAEVEALCALPAGWIAERTGVRERRWVNGETQLFMAAQAAREAVAQAGLPLAAIDLIINASGTQSQAIPDNGPLLQRELGLGESGIPSFSVHATCLSFLMAMQTAAALLLTDRYRHILIVSADLASCALNFKEPESAALMGDAAAAVVVTRTPPGEASAPCAFHFATYGLGADLAEVRGGGSRRHPNHAATQTEDNLFHMNGPHLLKLTRRVAPAFLDGLQPGLSRSAAGIDLIVPHQASVLGLRLLRHFGWPEERIMVTLDYLGNCVAASIPVSLYQAYAQGRLRRGDRVLLIGTGAGLSLGGLILTF